MARKWIVGVTGASGIRYATRLVQIASLHLDEVHVVFSEAALRVLNEEEHVKLSFGKLSSRTLFNEERSNCFFHHPKDIGAPIASGSKIFEGMVIIPCSMGTLGAVSAGLSTNLVQRAADVTLKEQRKLILVPRETPLSTIHLENMLKLSRMGVSIVPAMPGFYHQPESVDDIVDMMVMKVLDQMKIDCDLVKRWGSTIEQGEAVVPPSDLAAPENEH